MKYEMVDIERCDVLKRNPQYLTPTTQRRLAESIGRDGFVVPILLRPIENGRFEVVSGNHRFMAARDAGLKNVPAVIKEMNSDEAARLALNLNLIHGDPTAEQLAPFLAELSDAVLKDIHLNDDLISKIEEFDVELTQRLQNFEAPSAVDNDSVKINPKLLECPKCHHLYKK